MSKRYQSDLTDKQWAIIVAEDKGIIVGMMSFTTDEGGNRTSQTALYSS